MLQSRQVGESERGQAVSGPVFRTMPPRCEGAQVAVGKGEHDEIGRALAQVDGRLGFVQTVAFAKDDVHRPQSHREG